MSKTRQLRQMLTNKELDFIMEAHNGLSAKIVEEAGFKGIWASGLSMSAAMGVRDNNEGKPVQTSTKKKSFLDTSSRNCRIHERCYKDPNSFGWRHRIR